MADKYPELFRKKNRFKHDAEEFYFSNYGLEAAVNSVTQHRQDLKETNFWDIPLWEFFEHILEMKAYGEYIKTEQKIANE